MKDGLLEECFIGLLFSKVMDSILAYLDSKFDLQNLLLLDEKMTLFFSLYHNKK